jgi:hypothetical protein
MANFITGRALYIPLPTYRNPTSPLLRRRYRRIEL